MEKKIAFCSATEIGTYRHAYPAYICALLQFEPASAVEQQECRSFPLARNFRDSEHWPSASRTWRSSTSDSLDVWMDGYKVDVVKGIEISDYFEQQLLPECSACGQVCEGAIAVL